MARRWSVFFRALHPIVILKSKRLGRRWLPQPLLALTVAFLCIVGSSALSKAPAASYAVQNSTPYSVNNPTQPINLSSSQALLAEKEARSEASGSAATDNLSQPESLVEYGKKLYQSEHFTESIQVLQQAIAAFKATGDRLSVAMTLSNLSLAYQQLGLWSQAQSAITESLNLLEYSHHKNIETGKIAGNSPNQDLQILGQTLDIRGQLQLVLGKTEEAINTWQQAASVYKQIGDDAALTRNRINYAQALQGLGLYLQAQKVLVDVEKTLEKQPSSSLKAIELRSFGNVLRVIGDLKRSQQMLKQSLDMATALGSNQAISDALFSLGNTARAQKNPEAALEYYQKAIKASFDSGKIVQSQLNQLSLLIEIKRFPNALALSSQIESKISNLSPSRMTVYAKINFAQSLMKLRIPESATPTPQKIAQILASAIKQAQSLQDKRAESYALGTLGELYEKTNQFSYAQELTQKALTTLQSINASDIAYQWQWQMGRLLKKNGDIKGAIAAYDVAYKTLQSLRTDLVAVNSDIQFSFREHVEPVYRELVGLLLYTEGNSQPNPENLKRARDVIESLQLAELNNFFRSACLNGNQAIDPIIDQKDQQAAVIYPIILLNSLNVILKLPNQQLRFYKTSIDEYKLEKTIAYLRSKLLDVAETIQVQHQSQQIYDWLIRPAETELAKSGIKTLVFVLDGELRNVPMAVLYDKKHQKYLVQKYAIALAPSLQLIHPIPLRQVRLSALTAGVAQERFGFPELQNVPQELKQIRTEIPKSQQLLDQNFTELNLEKHLKSTSYSVVHLATHGEFSSDPDKTFILTWDKLVQVKDFDTLLRLSGESKSSAIELLVLSACKTAEGDKRAALGLAGVAVRAGARSTLATLWSVDDQYTTELMGEFYRNLKARVTKAQALQQAQLAVFTHEKRPYFWAPYVLVGNWF